MLFKYSKALNIISLLYMLMESVGNTLSVPCCPHFSILSRLSFTLSFSLSLPLPFPLLLLLILSHIHILGLDEGRSCLRMDSTRVSLKMFTGIYLSTSLFSISFSRSLSVSLFLSALPLLSPLSLLI